jgi:RNA polymerase sigma factor (sigma-70 family)
MSKYTRSDEKALFRQAQAGDAASVETLMGRHESLVHAVVREQWSGDWRYADIVHEGRIGLWRAILKYDPEYGTAFSTYAWPAIAHQIWDAVEREAAHANHTPGEGSLALAPDVALEVQAAQVRAALRQTVTQLPEKERWIVARYYGLDGGGGCSQEALGQVLGCTRQGVGYHLQKALRRLRHPGWSARLRAMLGYNDREAYRAAVAPQKGGGP